MSTSLTIRVEYGYKIVGSDSWKIHNLVPDEDFEDIVYPDLPYLDREAMIRGDLDDREAFLDHAETALRDLSKKVGLEVEAGIVGSLLSEEYTILLMVPEAGKESDDDTIMLGEVSLQVDERWDAVLREALTLLALRPVQPYPQWIATAVHG